MNNLLGIFRTKVLPDDMITVVDPLDRGVHKGCMYTASEIITIPATTSLFVAGIVGNKYVHMTPPRITSSKENVEIYAYKNCDFNNGSSITVNNHNTESAIQSVLDLRLTPTITLAGTKFYTDFIAGSEAVGGRSSGGQSKDIKNWLLHPTKKYYLTIKNNFDGDNKIHLVLQWLETINIR